MATSSTVLLVPGYANSGPDHWQSLWERDHPEYARVRQRDWERPAREEWVATLDEAIARVAGPVTLVAHSLGCQAVAHWASHAPHAAQTVRGALLVAPVDDEAVAAIPAISGFRPAPRARLPFRSILVASENDPYISLARSQRLAEWWGSQFISLGAAGHINTDAGFGPWPAGEALLATLR
jgi:predicted alpha/beta hydrolase family esterase